MEVVQAVNCPQVQLLYDFFHKQISAGNLIAKLEKSISHLGLVHVADVPGQHEPKTGEINYANIFGKLAKLNYTNGGHGVSTNRRPRHTTKNWHAISHCGRGVRPRIRGRAVLTEACGDLLRASGVS